MITIGKKQRIFVESYDGNAAQAMRIAGYEGADNYLEMQGNKLLADPLIREAIKQRDLYTNSVTKVIADRVERQAFWTSIMRNEDPNAKLEIDPKTNVTKVPENVPLPMRLKASELLGKSETDFIEKINVSHSLSISDVIKDSYSISMDNIDAIEAEYEAQRSVKKIRDVEAEVVVVEQDEQDIPLRDNLSIPRLDDFL